MFNMQNQKRAVLIHIFAASLMVACNSSSSFDKRIDMGGSADAHWLADIQSCIAHLSKNKYVFGKNDLDCTNGTAGLDCSGFVNNVAQAYFPDAYSALVTQAKGRPDVANYYTLIKNSTPSSPLTSVESITDLAAGDIVTWIYQGAEKTKLGASGHMMLVLAPAQAMSANVYKVLVADSAETGHDDDTRTKGQTGLGMGYIYFKTDANQAPIAYAWDNPKNWSSKSPIALGHFVD